MTVRPLPAAETVAKAFGLLQHGEHLTPAERGQLMISLSETADAVFKADRVADHLTKVNRAIAMLERAKAEHHIDKIDPLVEQIKRAVAKGETEPSDLLTLESKLHEVRCHLEEHVNGKE
jgi:hypothetical protein